MDVVTKTTNVVTELVMMTIDPVHTMRSGAIQPMLRLGFREGSRAVWMGYAAVDSLIEHLTEYRDILKRLDEERRDWRGDDV